MLNSVNWRGRALLGWPVVLAALSSPGTARAGEPGFATLDRVDADSHIDGALGIGYYPDAEESLGARLDLSAQVMVVRQFGSYVAMPFAFSSQGDESELAVGNLEGGGLYVHRAQWGWLVGRAGLALPLADDDVAGSTTNLQSAPGRMTDLALAIPDATYLRLSGSARYQLEKLYARADVGLDAPIGSDSAPLLLRLNLGIGHIIGPMAAEAELVTVSTSDDAAWANEKAVHTWAITVAGASGRGFASVVGLLDGDVRGQAYVLLLGVRASLPGVGEPAGAR